MRVRFLLVYKRITEDNCPAEINLESNKIRIGLGTKDYDVYAVYSGKTESTVVISLNVNTYRHWFMCLKS